MFSDFFISRPRFAFVISIVITLAGVIALQALPVAEYPDITPPQVKVTAVYSGANADVVYRQGVRIGVGLVGMLVLSQVPPHVLRIWRIIMTSPRW